MVARATAGPDPAEQRNSTHGSQVWGASTHEGGRKVCGDEKGSRPEES
jgi:hypothetical protein